ncbi:hypothetical protein WN55_01052 [Dufourea novaeangliae]|uniref:Uncharacterized protein n=1 Tax=Dufourea novaeangliae TaxID=178035 RepID=A0A154PDV1_DUFNO|nr:hypothetical protein WN55_01052 [Dufourea novaeangliae]
MPCRQWGENDLERNAIEKKKDRKIRATRVYPIERTRSRDDILVSIVFDESTLDGDVGGR